METRASYLLVGVFVLSLLAGAFGFALWLTRASLQDDRVFYYVYFTGSVAGLQNGSAVQYRGVPVGNVTDISIDEGNVEQIQVTVAIKPNTPIKADTVAQLQLQGITGLSFVQLSGGTQSSPDLEIRPGKRRAVIQSKASPLEQVFEHIPEVAAQIVQLTSRANDLLRDENREAIGSLLVNLNTIIDTIAQSREDVQALLKNSAGSMTSIQSAAQSLDALAGDLRGLTATLGADARKLVGNSDETIRTFRKMADEFHGLAAENRIALRDFSETGLYELSQFLAEARSLAASLNRLATQFERDPARFLFGDQQKGVEAR